MEKGNEISLKEVFARASRRHCFLVHTGGLLSAEEVVKSMLLSVAGVADVYPDLTERQVFDMSIAAVRLADTTIWIMDLPDEKQSPDSTREKFDPSQPHSEILAERDGSDIRFYHLAPSTPQSLNPS